MNPFKMTKRLNGVSKSGEILPKPVTLITPSKCAGESTKGHLAITQKVILKIRKLETKVAMIFVELDLIPYLN